MCYLPPDTYLGIVSIPDSPFYLPIWVNLPWTHSLWCDDIHLSGEYVCFPNQGRLLYFTNTYFSEQEHIIFVELFIKTCNNPPFSPKYDWNIWLYSTLTEAYFNGTKTFFRNSTWLGKTHRSMATFCITSIIKYNHMR